MATLSARQPSVLPSPFSTALSTQPPSLQHSQRNLTPPDSGPATPNDQSPSSPRSTWQGPANISFQPKQIRSPRAPMYVPAVLRPTESPVKASPPKGASPEHHDFLVNSSNEHDSTPASRPTPSMRRMVTEEWLESSMGKVTGPPSRNHWKPDPSSPKCDSPTCEKSFSFLTRRHHCRRCGHIFCSQHSPHSVPLDQHARFHPLAQRFRACDDCFRDYRLWETGRLQRANDAERASTADGPGRSSVDIAPKKGIINTIAASVPRDWSWSTF